MNIYVRIWILGLYGYISKEGAIVGLKRVSTPGLRVYKSYRDMPRVLSGLGISVVSTSAGILSSRKAATLKLGGEVICNIW